MTQMIAQPSFEYADFVFHSKPLKDGNDLVDH